MMHVLCTVVITAMVLNTGSSNASSRNNTMPSPPTHIFQFELSDAAVPNKHTEETIRQGRARSLQQQHLSGPATFVSSKHSPNVQQTARVRNQRHHWGNQTRSPDLATVESRTVQIHLPISDLQGPHPIPQYTRQTDANARNENHQRQFPVEVRNVIDYVLQKNPGRVDPNTHHNTQIKQHSAFNTPKSNSHRALSTAQLQWWLPNIRSTRILNHNDHQIVPDMNYNTIQSSIQHKPPANHLFVHDPHTGSQNVGGAFRILVPSNSLDNFENEPTTSNPVEPAVRSNQSPPQLIGENWIVGPEAHQQHRTHHAVRPQDSTAPVLFPLGARLPLPPSNFSAAVVNKYQTQASIATPVISTDFGHQPGKPDALLAVGDNAAQQYYNELDSDQDRPIAPATTINEQQFFSPVIFYSPKDHTPIIETPAEEDNVDGRGLKLEKTAFGFVPHAITNTILPTQPPAVVAPTRQILAPYSPKSPPQPTSYSKFRGTVASHPFNQHQYAAGYTFGYRVRDVHTGNDFGHTQKRDKDGVTHGEYHIMLPDGRLQSVKYMADDEGFHADVRYNGAGGGINGRAQAEANKYSGADVPSSTA